MHQLFHGDCLDVLRQLGRFSTIFADPPDNINLKYGTYQDRLPDQEYVGLLRKWLSSLVLAADTVWFSYNARWTFEVGKIVVDLVGLRAGNLEAKPCVQTFTFGQNNQRDLGNNHRPLLRIRWRDAPLYPDAIRMESWRQAHGDKRADPRGRVPGDVFDFPSRDWQQQAAAALAPNATPRGFSATLSAFDHEARRPGLRSVWRHGNHAARVPANRPRLHAD